MLDIERELEEENAAVAEDTAVADERALDAYSTIVTTVAEVVVPSVASLQVSHRLRNGRLAQGAGSAVAGVGLGLAVPMNATTRRIVAALMSEGRFRRAYLGIAGGRRPLPPRAADALGRRFGVEVVQVVEDSPAAKAGLRQEDLILDIDETPVEQPGDLQRLMISDRIGRAVCVRLFRNGDIVEVTVHPVELEH